MDRQRMLLTGSAGFIGSNFVRKVIYDKQPYELYSVDKIVNSSMLNNIYQHKLHEFYIVDICDAHIMDKIFEYVRPDVVVHMAAESDVDKSIKEPDIFVRSNVLGTQNMINLALKYKVRKFLQISTDEVLGSLDSGAALWKEDAPLAPRNPYAASKAAAELMVRAAGHTHGLPYIITRSANNYGPRQTPQKLIPRIIKSILEDQLIPVYGKGEQMRDWIHVVDNCAAYLTILEKGQVGEIYNISHNQEMRNLDVADSVIKIMGKGQINFVADRLGHDFRYGMDASKLSALGWRPIYKFQDGLKSCVSWFVDNKWFLT